MTSRKRPGEYVGFRCPTKLKRALARAAKINWRSLSTEVLFRLEQSSRDDKVIAAIATMGGWRPMVDAPRDGSAIIALYTDCSGVEMIRWGMYDEEPNEEAWFEADWHDTSAQDWLGWIPCPDLPRSKDRP